MTPAPIPVPGPLDREPTHLTTQDARAHLGAALQRIPRGPYDDQIAAWLSGQDAGVIAAVASWLRRSYEAGIRDARTEDVEDRLTGGGAR